MVRSYLAGGIFVALGTYLCGRFTGSVDFICIILVVAGAMTMWTMYNDMKRLVRFKVGLAKLKKSLLLILPFLLTIPLSQAPPNFALSFSVVVIAGLYLLFVVYRLTPFLFAKRKGT